MRSEKQNNLPPVALGLFPQEPASSSGRCVSGVTFGLASPQDTPASARPGDLAALKRANALQSIAGAGPKRLRLFSRALDGTASPRAAIKCKCLECVWLDQSAITSCSAVECPLWQYRPYQKKERK
jgi:hypothetical protein